MSKHRFTIYDKMQGDGYFSANPANPDSRDPTTGDSIYQGPVEFPKMLYHPEGEEKIIVPAEIITTPLGPKAVGEQRELIYEIVQNKAEEAVLLAEGWHTHPAPAMRRRVELFIEANPEISEKDKAKMLKAIPGVSRVDRVKELEEELHRLTGGKSAPAPTPGPLQPLASANALGARFGTEPSPPQA